MNVIVSLLLAIVLLGINAYFVAAEFAVTSSRLSRVEPIAQEGNKRAKVVVRALERISLMLAVCQLGVTLCSIGLGAIAEPALAHLFEVPLKSLGVPEIWSHVVAVFVALLIVVALHVILGEMVPKNLTVTFPEQTAMILVPSLVFLSKVTFPLIWLLNATANLFVRMLGVQPRDHVSAAFSAEEVASIIERSEAEGVLQDDLGILSGVIDFTARTVGEIMVRPEDVVSVGIKTTPQEVENAVAHTGFSRFPVIDEEGNMLAYIHLKDVLYASPSQRNHPVPRWRMHDFAVVLESVEADRALGDLQAKGAHIAQVKNDLGEIVGLVFIEDIIEELVGEVRDSMQRA